MCVFTFVKASLVSRSEQECNKSSDNVLKFPFAMMQLNSTRSQSRTCKLNKGDRWSSDGGGN